jgi:hypothetical protein
LKKIYDNKKEMPRVNWGSSDVDINEQKVYSQKVPDEFELDDADECLQLKNHKLYIICGPSKVVNQIQ